MTALYMFLAAVCILGPLVALHEFGHYIVGFGPKLLAWTSKRSGIRYQIAAIPLGGYVKMLDSRQESVADELKSVAFNHQHPLKKIAIVAAGPVMNFLIAIGLFWVLFLLPSEQLNTRIGEIIDNSPAATSGLVVGDKISVSIQNQSILGSRPPTHWHLKWVKVPPFTLVSIVMGKYFKKLPRFYILCRPKTVVSLMIL